MNKVINADWTISKIINTVNEAQLILKELGFKDITNPIMLNSVGKIMTLRKGALMKKIDLNLIKERFRSHGIDLEV